VIALAICGVTGRCTAGTSSRRTFSPTMELVLITSPTPLQRHFDETFHGWLLNP
jgi:hypothetical protein